MAQDDNYYEYVAWRSRMSPFWNTNWLNWDIKESEGVGGSLGDSANTNFFNSQPVGLWSLCVGNDGGLGVGADEDTGGYGMLASSEATDVVGKWNPSSGTTCSSTVTTIGGKTLYNGAKFCNGGEQWLQT